MLLFFVCFVCVDSNIIIFLNNLELLICLWRFRFVVYIAAVQTQYTTIKFLRTIFQQIESRLIIGSLWYCDNISQTEHSYPTVPHSINYSSERCSDLCLPSHTVWCVRCDVAYSVERSVLCKLVCQLLFPGLLPCGTLTELQMVYQKLYANVHSNSLYIETGTKSLRVPLSCSGAL